MIKDNKIFDKNFYSRIKLYGYSYIQKETTIPNIFIKKYIFYIESHKEKYELALVTFDEENKNSIYNIVLNEVEHFQMPEKSNLYSYKFYLNRDPIVHLSYDDYIAATSGYMHQPKNQTAKYITNNRFNSEFAICENFGISFENKDEIDNKYIKESINNENEVGYLYINELSFTRCNRGELKGMLDENVIESNCCLSTENINELEKLLQIN